MQTREEKIFQRIGHCVMIVLSACAIIPMILLVMSSVTDNNTLISNGIFPFFRRNSACMRINIFLRPEMQFCRHMEFLLY